MRSIPILVAGLLLPFLSLGSAEASVIVTASELGSDVIMTGAGTFDLSGLTLAGGFFPFVPSVAPSVAYLNLSQGQGSAYSGLSGPSSFGAGSTTIATSGTGDMMGVYGNAGLLIIPLNYLSGTALWGTATYMGHTLASLGLTPGSFVWSWGDGATSDSLTLNVGTVPVPAGLPLLGAGLGLLGLLAWRQKCSPIAHSVAA